MKVFITIKLTILTLLLAFNVYSQPNPDFDPHGVKLIIPPFKMGINAGDIVSTWDTIRATPLVYSRSASALVTLNGIKYIYQFGGGLDTQTKMVARYDFSNGTWSTNFARIPSGMSGASAVTIGTNIYLFGGEFVSGLGKTYKYDAVNNVWTAMANMLTPVTDAAVINYDNNLIYVIGGGNGLFGTQEPYTNAVQLYNIGSNSYSTATNYPITAGMMGIGNWLDTIICVGGYTGAKATDTVFKGVINKTNPSVITWSGTKYPKYPAGPVTRPSSVNIRFANAVGVLFAGGAGNGVNALFNAYYWDFNLLMWRNLPDMIMPKCNSKAVFSGDSVAYMIAGYSDLPTGRNDKITFRKIDGISNTLNDFRLRYPLNNSTITSVIGSSLPVLFSWDSSGTGAIYKWSFEKNGTPNTRIDTIVIGLNVFKITENELDKLLTSKLNMNQGDSVTGKWYVYAFKGPGAPGVRDSIPSDTLNLTFKRFKPTLSAFNLVSPVDGSKILTSKSFVYPVSFYWTKAAVYGTKYKLYYIDSVRNKQFVLQSGNSGTDTVLSLPNKILDTLIEKVINVPRGDSTVGKWKVYAYTGNDSLVSAQSFNITFNRTLNEVAPFTVLLPVDSTQITVSNFASLDFHWSTSAIGATYKWQFSTTANFLSFVSLPSNNSGYDTVLTVQTTALVQLLGITSGGTVSGFWRAYSYKGTDSLPTTNKFVIKFINSGNQQLLQKFVLSESFPPPGWNLQYTGARKWEKTTYTSPFPLPYDTAVTGCAKFDFFTTEKGVKQTLITNIFYQTRGEPSTPIKFDSLMFDYAHAYFGEANIDSLLIFSSTTDNGAISDTLVFLSSSPNFNSFKSLSTVTYQNGPYTPLASDWKTKKIAVPVGTRRIKFVALSGWGNNLYIDNIRIRDKAPEYTGIPTGTAHTETFRWFTSYVPGTVHFLQITEVNDTNFLSGFKSGPLTALPGATASYITSVSDINLIAYKTYQFRFRSFNAADSSNWSVPGTFKRDSLSVLRQAFADATFPPFPWSTSINNDTVPPLSTFWLRATVGGNTTTNTAAKFDFWNAPYGKLRSLISNSFAPRYSGADDTLYFEVAHAYKNTVNIDTLFIYTSINYGTTWGTSPIRTLVSSQVFNDSTLSTTTSTTEFTPSQTTHWKTIKFLVNPEVKKIKFECLSSNGNNLYITNVRLGPSLTGEMLTLNEPPKQYELHLNYPNPFNPTTTISYAIPKTSLTKLVIYDVLGREIVKLVNEVKNPGNYSITFNANNLASGVYFYRLEAGDFVDVKKMLLIK